VDKETRVRLYLTPTSASYVLVVRTVCDCIQWARAEFIYVSLLLTPFIQTLQAYRASDMFMREFCVGADVWRNHGVLISDDVQFHYFPGDIWPISEPTTLWIRNRSSNQSVRKVLCLHANAWPSISFSASSNRHSHVTHIWHPWTYIAEKRR
jgi:hypothetical protein